MTPGRKQILPGGGRLKGGVAPSFVFFANERGKKSHRKLTRERVLTSDGHS